MSNTRSLFDDDPEPTPSPAPSEKGADTEAPAKKKRKRRTKAEMAAAKKAAADKKAAEQEGKSGDPEEPAADGSVFSDDAPGEPAETETPKRRRRRKPPTAEEASKSVEELFESASPLPINGPLPEMRAGFMVIVDRVHDIPDPEVEYDRLVTALQLEDELTPINIQAALNAAQKLALAAYQLFRVAKAEHLAFENSCAEFKAALRDAANHELQSEKDAGTRSKAITEADVIGRIAQSFPDAWRDLIDREIKARSTIRQLERLADLWKGRCRSLERMLAAAS